jgi:hypothetical protein
VVYKRDVVPMYSSVPGEISETYYHLDAGIIKMITKDGDVWELLKVDTL